MIFILFNITYQQGFDAFLAKLQNLHFGLSSADRNLAFRHIAKRFTLFVQDLDVAIMTEIQISPVTGFVQIEVTGDVTLCSLEDR
jgi:hypothetical protein